jgi:limonene-1,2-epoxide hydrolase
MVDGLDEVQFVVHRQTVTGDTVMNERTDRFRVGEKWMDLPVMGVFVVGDDGLISLWRDYFDVQTLNEQLAAILS